MVERGRNFIGGVTLKVHRLFPRDRQEGSYLENVSTFAARRCRTTLSHEELWEEVVGYSDERRAEFLDKVVNQDWALDVLEFPHLIYDVEDVPIWLIIEFLRHRLVWRDFSMEQLSQRAIMSSRLRFECHPELHDLTDKYVRSLLEEISVGRISPEEARKSFPQGVLVNFVLGANLRAFQHFFFMRCSPERGGKGGAHPEFMQLADVMLSLAKEVYPTVLGEVLPS